MKETKNLTAQDLVDTLEQLEKIADEYVETFSTMVNKIDDLIDNKPENSNASWVLKCFSESLSNRAIQILRRTSHEIEKL